MPIRHLAYAATSSLAALLCWGAAATTAIAAPLEAYGRLPSIEDVQISPDGSKLAFVRTTTDERTLTVVEVDHTRVVNAIPVGDVRLRRLEWADDQHLLITTASNVMPFELDGEPQEWNLMKVYDLRSHRLEPLLSRGESDHTGTLNVVFGEPVIRRGHGETLVYLQGAYVDGERLAMALFRVNLTTGSERLLKRGTGSTHGWLIDDSGEIVAEKAYVEPARRWEIRLLREGRVHQSVSGVAAIDAPELLGFSSSGDSIIAAVPETSGTSWKTLLLKDGSWGADVAADRPATNLIFLPGSERMIGTALVADEAEYRFNEPALQEGWDWVVRSFGGDRVELVSMAANRTRLIVLVTGRGHGFAYYLADLSEHYTELIGDVYDGVRHIADIRRFSYPASDGLSIPAYLTLPPVALPIRGRGLPLIVLVHGGPEARDHLRFDWWAQALAAEGYAVLQANFRGSALSQQWAAAGYGEWGRKMQTDLLDGVRYLAAQRIVDPYRVCIVGASYGGYAALAGVALESGIYRCAVSVAGITDPASYLDWVARVDTKLTVRYWQRLLGVDDSSDPRLDDISPLKHADQISVPVMLIHGRDDTSVPFEQTERMARALRRGGHPAALVALVKEDHQLSRSATRLRMLSATAEFLRHYNPAVSTLPGDAR
jgi:dipeptidyl aminopeptidase/acylaminoacyl peptidase